MNSQETVISNLRLQAIRSKIPLENVQSTAVYHTLDKKLHRKATRRRLVRYGILSANALLLIGVVGFVLAGHRPDGTIKASSLQPVQQQADSLANPVDQVSSADIAVNVARMSALPEATAVVNQADSMNTEFMLAPAGTSIVAKPQVVATALKSRKDIQTYVAVAGDTVSSIADAFKVTSDSVKWSNNLLTNNVTAGQSLLIPPVPGIVYTVKDGDTPDSLATKYKASRDQIIAANDAEIEGLKVGERILIPDGVLPTPVATVSSSTAGYAWGASPIYGFNGYTYGYCTWYVASKIAVPANWGNANTWDNRAAMSGWIVSSTPRVGAIAQTDRGSEGHVAIVEAVSEDGSQIKYSDMNGVAGWGRVGYSDWVSSSKFEHYIYQ